MTMIGAVRYKNIFGLETNHFIMAGDTRITRPSKESDRFVSRFDSAQKIIELSPNILLGIAGDYGILRLVFELESQLKNKDFGGSPIHHQYIGFLRKDIVSFLKKSFPEDWSETSLFLILQDYKSKVTRLFVLELPKGTLVELDDGVSFIGGDAQLRAKLKQEYELNFEHCLKQSIDVDNSASVALPLLMTLGQLNTEDIGGSTIAYYMKPDGGWCSLGNSMGFNNGQNFVSHGLTNEGWEQQVNGKIHAKITKDYEKVDSMLNKNVKSK